jgi:siroheme synthase
MGVANAAALRDRLMLAGRRGDTPAAVIEWGTCARQRVEVGTLEILPDVIERAGIGAPAVIVIGETVRLRSVLGSSEVRKLGRPESVLSV